jgi:hypothetical protein
VADDVHVVLFPMLREKRSSTTFAVADTVRTWLDRSCHGTLLKRIDPRGLGVVPLAREMGWRQSHHIPLGTATPHPRGGPRRTTGVTPLVVLEA